MASNFKDICTEAMNKALSKLQEADGDNNFVSVATTANSFDPSKGPVEIENDISEEKKAEKAKLTTKAVEKIKQSLEVTDELQAILNKIDKINKDHDINEWKVNEEHNTASLRNKNAYIFKQNNNLCLSHDDKVEIFKSVPELHDWLCKNHYPLPHDIQLHEAVEENPYVLLGRICKNSTEDSWIQKKAKELANGFEYGDIDYSTFAKRLNDLVMINDFKMTDGVITEDYFDYLNSAEPIPTEEIIPHHVDDSLLVRFLSEYGNTPWGKILKGRTDNLGTKAGAILGATDAKPTANTPEYSANNYLTGFDTTPDVKEDELFDGTKIYYNAKDLGKNKPVNVYLKPEQVTSKNQRAFAYIMPDGTIKNTQGEPLETTSEIDAADTKYKKSSSKMGKDQEKIARWQADIKPTRVSNPLGGEKMYGWNDLGSFVGPDTAKAFNIAGPRANEYIGNVSQDGTQCLNVDGEVVGTVKDGKVYDYRHPDIEIAYVDNDGRCFGKGNTKGRKNEASENQIDNVWYLKYNNSALDQNYLNANWKEQDLLTQNLEDAAKFISRDEAMDELRDLYLTKTTEFPFEPINVDSIEECGCAGGVTSAGLGQAVKWFGNKKQESAEEELDEDKKRDAFTQSTRDLGKKLLIGAPVYYGDEIIGTVTDRATARNDATLAGDNSTKIINFDGNEIGTSKNSYPLAKTLQGDTLGYIHGGKVFSTNNKLIGSVIDDSVYDTKNNKIGVASDDDYMIIRDTNQYPIGYIEDGEAFSFTDDKIGDVADTNDYEGTSASEKNYIVQDLAGNDIGWTSIHGNTYDFNGRKIGRVDLNQRAKEAGFTHGDLSKIADDKGLQKAQANFEWFATGKKAFNPYNKAGKIKDLYKNAINPGHYTAERLFGGIFDTSSNEINKLLVDKDTFVQRVNEVNTLHGVNFDPEAPIYPRKASKGTINQQAWRDLTNKYMQDVELRKSAHGQSRIPNADEETWNTSAKTAVNDEKNKANIMSKVDEVKNSAIANYDAGKTNTAYNEIFSYLNSIKNNEQLNDITKSMIYKTFLNTGIDGIDQAINMFFLNGLAKNESVLTEDDTPADFADGGSADVKIADVAETQPASQNPGDSVTDGLDDYGPEDPSAGGDNAPMQFGDVNINGGGGAPEEEPMPQQPESNEEIIDVLVNERDNSQIKVKTKDKETGEVKVKDLKEIDV